MKIMTHGSSFVTKSLREEFLNAYAKTLFSFGARFTVYSVLTTHDEVVATATSTDTKTTLAYLNSKGHVALRDIHLTNHKTDSTLTIATTDINFVARCKLAVAIFYITKILDVVKNNESVAKLFDTSSLHHYKEILSEHLLEENFELTSCVDDITSVVDGIVASINKLSTLGTQLAFADDRLMQHFMVITTYVDVDKSAEFFMDPTDRDMYLFAAQITECRTYCGELSNECLDFISFMQAQLKQQ